MDERTLIFQKVQKGEVIFTLEKDRRSGYPIFDTARIVKVGESKNQWPLVLKTALLTVSNW